VASRFANVAGAVLTGGASTRMGRDKAHLPLCGVSAAARVADVLSRLVADVVLVGGEPPPEASGRRVPDGPGPRCALRGVVSALEAVSAERVLVVATDLPLVTPDLLLALVAWPESDAVVPRNADGAQPLCALYRREPALARAREQLAAGRLALRGLLETLETRYLEPDDLAAVDPLGIALHNVNTPDDWARAEAWLAAAAQSDESGESEESDEPGAGGGSTPAE
jgi:molybdenum cofactor guanylyltransferase